MCSIILDSSVAGRLLPARGRLAPAPRESHALPAAFVPLPYADRYAQRCLKATNRDAPQSWGCPYNAIITMGQR